MNVHAKHLYFSVFLLFINLFLSGPALAQIEEEIKILQMYFKEDELVVTSTRTTKPISQVAANISVITSEDIEEMNYHTLAEVLNHIPGMQVDLRTPWAATVFIQGNKQEYSTIKIDGVTMNFLSSNSFNAGVIPVKNIKKIEIIKGPASSVWGSSLGGIINIITKPAGNTEKLDGIISASYGERDTGDFMTETSGRVDNLGFYIYAGKLHSDGFMPNTGFDENNLYTKLHWDITDMANILLTFGYIEESIGLGRVVIPEMPPFINTATPVSNADKSEYLFSTLSLNYSINNETDLTFSFRTSKNDWEMNANLDTGSELRDIKEIDRKTGGSATLTWKKETHNIVIGTDYDNGKPDFDDKVDWGSLNPLFCILDATSCATSTIDQDVENWAIYTNDTITFDKLSLTPGIRYDHANIGGEFTSPSLGITYKFTKETLLRAYIARGFNAPTLQDTHGIGYNFISNPELEVEKVWSYQAGVETTSFNYFRLKTSIFRHDISDAIVMDDSSNKMINQNKHRKQGIEAEIRTFSVYNTSLFVGFAYIDADNLTTGERVTEYAKYTWDVGLQYHYNDSFRSIIKGHYISWISDPKSSSKHDGFIWDINLIKEIYRKNESIVDAFVTVHNIFSSSQYLIQEFKNPSRWMEGGVKLKF
jgi:vitamin B12 transporter